MSVYKHDLPHEPQFAKSPESPAHFDTLARLLSVDPELVPAALANLIASERESAVHEFASAAADAIEDSGCTAGISCRCSIQRPLTRAAAIVRDLANTT